MLNVLLQTTTAERNEAMGYALGMSCPFIMIGGVVGGFMGASKNRTGLGILLGSLLFVVGWIILAFIPKRSRY